MMNHDHCRVSSWHHLLEWVVICSGHVEKAFNVIITLRRGRHVPLFHSAHSALWLAVLPTPGGVELQEARRPGAVGKGSDAGHKVEGCPDESRGHWLVQCIVHRIASLPGISPGPPSGVEVPAAPATMSQGWKEQGSSGGIVSHRTHVRHGSSIGTTFGSLTGPENVRLALAEDLSS